MKTSSTARWPLVLALVLIASMVHADAPPGQYSTAVLGTVKDTKTGLVWQRAEDSSLHNWATAKTTCESLNGGLLGGFSSGWRLPTLKELETIVDFTVQTTPAIDPAFTSTSPDFFWSTTPVANSTTKVWGVVFNYGALNSMPTSVASHVRCVH